MKLTKHPHAHLVIESEGQKLVIDPGAFSGDLGSIEAVTAVVITHNHADHFHADHIQTIRDQNPEVIVYSTPEVAEALPGTTVVKAGDTHVAGPFKLQFFGDMHAVIHPDFPYPHNTGVLVNDRFYYPGDSFVEPTVPVQVLALPANAPWASVQQTMDYLRTVKPAVCFPTHNALLSPEGTAIYNDWLQRAVKNQGTDFRYLDVGESLEF